MRKEGQVDYIGKFVLDTPQIISGVDKLTVIICKYRHLVAHKMFALVISAQTATLYFTSFKNRCSIGSPPDLHSTYRG